MLEKLKRIFFMSIGFVVLFTFITFITSLIKGDPFHFDIILDLVGAIICAIVVEIFPQP